KSTIKVNDRATSPRRSCRYQLSNYYRYRNCFTFRKYVKRNRGHLLWKQNGKTSSKVTHAIDLIRFFDWL
ncbi:MAG: hypothetical protein EWV41_17730, partial [Microcystis wesenbergii Mw_MB_S_20031200_S109]